jgi:hypothetical protein
LGWCFRRNCCCRWGGCHCRGRLSRRISVHSGLAGDALKGSKQTSIFILVRLKNDSTFVASVSPGDPDVVLFRLAESGDRANAERNHRQSDRSANSPVNFLAIAHLGNRVGRYRNDILRFVPKPDLVGVEVEF